MLSDVKFNLYLIRHGESEVNARPDEMGQTADVQLTTKGKEQARRLSIKFLLSGKRFDKIFSSPYERALKTAKIVVGRDHIEPIIFYTDELREYDAGDWTGASRSNTLTDDVKRRMSTYNMSFQPPNGESLNQVERRVSKWFEDEILYNNKFIESICESNNDGIIPNIALFSHGMTIKCFLHYVMGFDKSFAWRISIENTSVTKLHFDQNGWAVDYINNTSHLDGE